VKRRGVLLSGLGLAGALVVGWGLLPPRSRLGSAGTLPSADGVVGLNGWLRIAADGAVELAMNRSEMGQGVHTALAMMVAEELDVPLDRVRLIPAGPDRLYGNVAMLLGSLPLHPSETESGRASSFAKGGQWVVAKVARELGLNVTGGSSSVADAWDVLPLAAATARAQLLNAAALRWRLPAAELAVADGVVSHPSGPRAHFGELAKEAAATPAGDVVVKARADWKLLGSAPPRTDLAAKVDGRAVFGTDVRLPDLRFAVVRHCPMIGGSAGAVDVDAALQLPGVERVVRLGPYAGSTAALAVVGRSWWHARRGAEALRIEWQAPPAGPINTRAIEADLLQAAQTGAERGGGFPFYRRGDAAAAMAGAARRFVQTYRAPYLAHATLEPINCTARVHAGKVEIWVPTQVPGMARALAAKVAGVPDDAVTVHVTYLGGGFGRRLEVDVVGQAVRIALETGGRPVQLIWSREEDMTHDFYRPAGVAVLQAGLDAAGMPVALRVTSAGDAITPRWIERGLPHLAGPVDMPDKTASEGLFDLPYEIANQHIAHIATRHPMPIGFWRSVGHSHHAFFSEGFIDELAHEAGLDPVAYRLALLKDMPRHRAVLQLAAQKAGWPGHGAARALPAGVARGVALHESFGSIVAQVVEVTRVDGLPRVLRVVCAADVGTVIHPGIVAQQMEGAILFGLSAALHGRIDTENGVVRQTNFPAYRMVTLAESPAIETHLVPSTRHPGGVGEPGTPPIAPALANALYALTGQRLRELPLVR
jgi:isoquinoline 1-oxidoreductase beta subunit